MNASETSKEFRQVVRGVLQLGGVEEIDPELGIKLGLYRDCYPLVTQIYYLEDQQELEYELEFEHEGQRPMGVRLLAAPADVPDDQVAAVEHHQQYVAASEFQDGVAEVNVALAPELYLVWRRFCRTYTIRGRVVCRRIIWDPPNLPRICISPVRGATVTAFDVDRFWWWCRRDAVGSAVTDVNGNFEITFRFCCWWWLWPLHRWVLDPAVVRRIRKLVERVPLPDPLPRPQPEPDIALLSQLAGQLTPVPAALPAGEVLQTGQESLQSLGQTLVNQLPSAELHALHVWPWWPRFDCKPDIIFRVTQFCGRDEEVIYAETCDDARWNIDSVLDGVTLVANENACCAPCCDDPPDDDCLIFHGVGCGGFPITAIEQNAASPLAGYAQPGTNDKPFGRSIRLLGAFGNASDVDFYKLQYRRLAPAPTGWIDMPAAQMGTFYRGHWDGITSYQWETVNSQLIDGQDVYKTIHRYREENPGLPMVSPINGDWLGIWHTAQITASTEIPLLADGLYELRAVGYEFDENTQQLTDEQIMLLCPPPGDDPDPGATTSMLLRIDNRLATWSIGSIHVNTDEPDCDFPDICAVVKNEGKQDEECVNACGIVRLSAGDTLTVHFEASDADGHLSHYGLTAHWAESDVFNMLGVGTLAADPDMLVGPSYAQTFAGSQGAYRAGLPVTDDEHDRPFWYGGHFKVTVTVGDPVPGTEHSVFETCCAYLLRLDVWKRTTNGCSNIHRNLCEFSFTVLREDLENDPNCPEM